MDTYITRDTRISPLAELSKYSSRRGDDINIQLQHTIDAVDGGNHMFIEDIRMTTEQWLTVIKAVSTLVDIPLDADGWAFLLKAEVA